MDALADATLHRHKPFVAEGLPQPWRTGRLLEVVERNRGDDELSRDLDLFGRASASSARATPTARASWNRAMSGLTSTSSKSSAGSSC